jgi:ubiquinone/menaquinone biosynthesis C-methylase UbiE
MRMRFQHRLRSILFVLGLLLSVAAAGAYVGYRHGLVPVPLTIQDRDREKYQRPADVLKALDVSPGEWVADVGAGNGYYARHMADLVGPTGKVFGEDIDDDAIVTMRKRVKASGLRNLQIVKGTDDDPTLPANSLSAVLIMNAYHHFVNPEAMLNQILRALKPGGRLVIGDYSNPDHRNQSRENQLNIHEIDSELVQAELSSAGFQVVKCENPFMKRMPDANKPYRIKASDMWLITAIRPK